MKRYVGRSRAETLDWLANVWLNDGPPVCFLQGFPGVGKTDLARDLRELAEGQHWPDGKARWQQAVINEVADRATPSVLETLMELSFTLSQQGLPEMEQVLFDQKVPNLGYALERTLQRPVVIILDEAQRFFRDDTNAPLTEMAGILAFLRNRPKLPGRLLLLSDRMVQEARWSEWIPRRTLAKLEPDEAMEALDVKLDEAGLSIDISSDRRKEVVQDLDFNPRAIEALVGALRYESLDEIIESNPGLWAVRDRQVSRDFLKALERDLLDRTLRHLDGVHQQKLWRLAVHRRSFKREALEKLCGSMDEASELRSILVARYLLNFYKGTLSLNPIVREIALNHLRDDRAAFRQAHSSAADYHLRHFKAKQIVGSQYQLGDSFAELRYHLVQAGREAELGTIERRFTDHLKQGISAVSPVPRDLEELDERIGILAVLLEEGGAAGLEYYLARCLQARRKPGDIEQAVIHAQRAVGPRAPESAWYLLASLKHEAEGADAALEVIRRGIGSVTNSSSAQPLYQLGGEILAGAGKTDEAVALLRDGIKVVPPDKNLFALYQIGADLLAKTGKTDDAVALLRDGIKVVPPDKSLVALYRTGADLLAKAGKTDEAVALIEDGIKVIPPDKSLCSLYETGAELLAKAGKTDEAAALIEDGIKVIPPDQSLSLYQINAEIYCRAGRVGDAIASLKEGIARIPERFNRYKLGEATRYLSLALGDEANLSSVDSLAGGKEGASLGAVLQCLLRGDWHAAAAAANAARYEFPRYVALAYQEAYSRLAAGDAESAWQALARFPNLTFGSHQPQAWLASFIHLRRGARSEALAALAVYLGRPVDEGRELDESFLLRLWDQQVVVPDGNRLCFYFPIMPASLTGLDFDVRRVEFADPVLPVPGAAQSAGTITSPGLVRARTATTEVYVSYAWGEDSSVSGRQRENIVNAMCAAVTASGRTIGRDTDRMRGGDSIERFAQEISRAKRIIAVISEKSLHSEFCMAHELFRAFRRCDYQRAEFQEKVIALVMDDAKRFLTDPLAMVALAKSWQQRLNELRDELQSLDPTRKSPNLWVFVDLLEEMCPRLPDMLGALSDIVMKRGFEAIVADRFKEVIDRLPPPHHS